MKAAATRRQFDRAGQPTRSKGAVMAALIGVTCVGLVMRYWHLGGLPLFGDEAYYLLWADRLAPAYYDHPAGIAVLLKISIMLGGREELGVRWLNALLGAACVPLAFLVGRRYVNVVGGLIAATAIACAPVYVVTGRITYPDALQSFLLLLNLLIVGELSGTPAQRGRRESVLWVAFGITLALLMNVKLSSGFYVISLLLYAVLWQRALFKRRGLWLGAGVAALGLAPIAWWNATHDWAMVRWAIYHGQGYGVVQEGLRLMLAHVNAYHTPPAILLAGLGAVGAVLGFAWHGAAGRGSAEKDGDLPGAGRADWRILASAAACLLLPVLLSKADSPRNLGLGLIPLWPLAGLPANMAFSEAGQLRGTRRVVAAALTACTVPLCVGIAVYGAGTVLNLVAPAPPPHSSTAPGILGDAAAWPHFAAEVVLPEDALTYAIDYSIAGQITYYSGRPVYTSGPQYRLWGIPEADRLTVLGLSYVAPEKVTERLRADFAQVDGPALWLYADEGVEKQVYIWQVSGRRVAMTKVLNDLDYLDLVSTAPRASRLLLVQGKRENLTFPC